MTKPLTEYSDRQLESLRGDLHRQLTAPLPLYGDLETDALARPRLTELLHAINRELNRREDARA